MTNALDGRRVFHWQGRNREADLAALADAIAEAVPLFCREGGSLVRLDSTGQLVQVSFAAFRALVDQRICGERVVQRGGKWQREYFTYRFDPQQRPDASAAGPRPEPDESEPDDKVLDEIFRHELHWRIPKAL